VINFSIAIQAELAEQHAAAQKAAAVRAEAPSASDLLKRDTYKKLAEALAQFGIALPDIDELELGRVIDGAQTLCGDEGYSLALYNSENPPLIVLHTSDLRRFDIRSAEDAFVAIDAAAKDYLWQYSFEENGRRLSALRNMRPGMPTDINGFYGQLLVKFMDEDTPGATFYAFQGGTETRVLVRDYIFLCKLFTEEHPVGKADFKNQQFVRYDDGHVYMANLSTGTGTNFFIDGPDRNRLAFAMRRYIEWTARLGEWQKLVEQAGVTMEALEWD